MTTESHVRFNPAETHIFQNFPGSSRFTKIPRHTIHDAEGTWGLVGIAKRVQTKQISSGGYTVQHGKNTYYYKVPRSRKRVAIPAGKLPVSGNIMKVVGSERSEAPISFISGSYQPTNYNNMFIRRNGFYAPEAVPLLNEYNETTDNVQEPSKGQPVQLRQQDHDMPEYYHTARSIAKYEKQLQAKVRAEAKEMALKEKALNKAIEQSTIEMTDAPPLLANANPLDKSDAPKTTFLRQKRTTSVVGRSVGISKRMDVD